jgi:hypothetical protein
MRSLTVVPALLFSLCLQPAWADNASTEALQKTQRCLQSQNCDSANTDAGKAADQQALDAVGGNAASKQALYNLSSDILPLLVQQAEGDPLKLQALVAKAQMNPEAFLSSLPADVQAKIKSTAATVPSKP